MKILQAIVAAWASRKLWAFIITCGLLWIGLERIIWHMYAMDVAKLPSLVTIAGIVFTGMVAAAGAYMGFQSRFSGDSVVNILNEAVTNVTRTPKAQHFDDIDD